MIPRSTPQTILLSAMRELLNGADTAEAREVIGKRFSFLSQQQIAEYVATAGARLFAGQFVSSKLFDDSDEALPIASVDPSERRFAWVRFTGVDRNGNQWTRDVHIAVGNGSKIEDLATAAQQAAEELMDAPIRGGDDTAPFNAPDSPVNIQIIGLL